MSADTYFGILGYARPLSLADLSRAAEAALGRLGFTRSGPDTFADQRSRTLTIALGSPGAPGGCQHAWSAWAVFPIKFSEYESYGGELYVSVTRELAAATPTVLARSCHPMGLDFIECSELEGDVNYVDWLQYFGPELVQRLGLQRLRSAGFLSTETLTSGGLLALAKAEYLGECRNRRAIIESLGITPRRMLVRGMQVNWLGS
jgi:hypothetical protein